MWVLLGLGKKLDKIQAEMSMSAQYNNSIPTMSLQFNLRNSRQITQSMNDSVFNKHEAL